MLSAVIPTLNAANTLPVTLAALTGPGSVAADILVVDGGSTDGSIAVAETHGAQVVAAPRGRGLQLAAGAAAAGGDWLLFLHADTVPQPGWAEVVTDFMAGEGARAGYFRFALDDPSPEARRLERMVAWRCRALALPYGDQGLLISRQLYDAVGGYRPLPLMEDVDIVRRLGRRRLAELPAAAVTSAAKYRRDGWRLRSARNLGCLALYFAGVPPRLIRPLYG
jgi:rSAM/selenodomain-associated transferase 2